MCDSGPICACGGAGFALGDADVFWLAGAVLCGICAGLLDDAGGCWFATVLLARNIPEANKSVETIFSIRIIA